MKALIHIFYLLSINPEILNSISFIIFENTLGQADSLKSNKTSISRKKKLEMTSSTKKVPITFRPIQIRSKKFQQNRSKPVLAIACTQLVRKKGEEK